MADKKSILTLNLGSQRIGMARFTAGGKGSLQLTAYSVVDIPGDPTGDISRGPQIAAAVKQLATQLKATGEHVRYVISGQPVLSKFVKLPPLNVEKMDELIGFEAQQAIPFPISEVSWHYQLLNTGAEVVGEAEAVLAAVKADMLSELNSAVEGVPLVTDVVDIAPLALYNAFRFNYPDETRPALLVDLGSRCANLLYIESSGKFFFRTINNAGGASVTSSIAKEFGIDFTEAEERKIASGFVALSGYADHEDPDIAALSKVIRNALTRVHGEIVRTTNLYRSQQGGSAPEIIYLAGAGASLPYVKEFFEEKLNLPVEFFNALRQVAVGPKVDNEVAQASAHTMGELVGVGLRGAYSAPMELDLVPPAVAVRRDNARRKPFLFAGAAALLGVLAAGWLYNQSAASAFADRTAALTERKNELAGVDRLITEEDNRAKKEQARAELLNAAIEDRVYWLELFHHLNSLLNTDLIWITQFEPTIEGKSVTPTLVGTAKTITFEEPLRSSAPAAASTSRSSSRGRSAAPAQERFVDGIHIFGLYRNHNNEKGNQVVSDFFEELKKSPYFEIDPEEEYATYVRIDSPSDITWASGFEMRLPLKRKMQPTSSLKATSN